jgi:peptidyl-prolyl cis-trans isomerase B (cyclophilin B)
MAKKRKGGSVKKIAAPIKKLPVSQATEPAAEPAQDWKNKLQQYRNVLLVLGIVLVFGLGVATLALSSLKQKTGRNWQMLGNVLSAMQPNEILARDWKVKDLSASANQFVVETIKDISALPHNPGKTATLNELPFLYLPSAIQGEALRLHNISQLQGQLANSPANSATPWLKYLLGNLYVAEGGTEYLQKAEQQFQSIGSQYPKHPLNMEEMVYTTAYLSKELDWYRRNPQFALTAKLEEKGKYSATLTTSKGKVVIELFDQDCPTTAGQFIRLAQSGFYNGLNFYKVEADRNWGEDNKEQSSIWSVWTGCPLGNGKGGPGSTVNGELRDVWMQRGIVAMDNYEKTGVVGSRFFIMNKYREMLTPYPVFGKVSEGLQVVEQLTGQDILLDVSIK